MLPLRIRLAQMLETAAGDAGVLRRLIVLVTVLILVIGLVAAGGFDLSIRVGKDDSSAAGSADVSSI